MIKMREREKKKTQIVLFLPWSWRRWPVRILAGRPAGLVVTWRSAVTCHPAAAASHAGPLIA